MPDVPPRPSYICLRCGYNAGQPEPESCPECGELVTRNDVVMALRRQECVDANPARIRQTLLSAVIVGIIIAAALIMFIPGSPGRLFSAFLPSGWIAVSILPPYALGPLIAEHRRAINRFAWLHALPWLHFSWIVASLVIAVSFVTASFLGVIFKRSDGMVQTIGAVSVLVLVLTTFIPFYSWAKSWVGWNRHLGVIGQDRSGLMTVSGLFFVTISTLLSLFVIEWIARDFFR